MLNHDRTPRVNTEMKEVQIDCPRCAVPPGSRCVSTNGKQLPTAHKARYTRWRRIKGQEPTIAEARVMVILKAGGRIFRVTDGSWYLDLNNGSPRVRIYNSLVLRMKVKGFLK